MKRLISLFILIQVGSQLWVNPEKVVAVTSQEKSGYCNNGAEIVIETGSDYQHPYVCSDWDLKIVLDQLHYASDRNR